jgi:hypothetical protein
MDSFESDIREVIATCMEALTDRPVSVDALQAQTKLHDLAPYTTLKRIREEIGSALTVYLNGKHGMQTLTPDEDTTPLGDAIEAYVDRASNVAGVVRGVRRAKNQFVP